MHQTAHQATLDGFIHAHSRTLDRHDEEIERLTRQTAALAHDVANLRAALRLQTELLKSLLPAKPPAQP
jgi:DNA anti-recombination protein RmuC